MVTGTARALASAYGETPAPGFTSWESAAVEVAVRHGSRADAEAPLPVFPEAPAEALHTLGILEFENAEDLL
ncbi:hypothetical protein ABT337_14975 [Saccharopolyspora hirsuta]|uniref:Uncharacterized protein n=1 Tax=Saccharopolyspora hirsuta TaxID=1837 RepID=A0A5M7C798_SACHI|nr:hypothetical protein [Saccharopolyspora hirsuta]KAA5837300.1 hypothetical protein F1721_05760 [Saccharopolyspora hirsuta]